MRFLTLFLFLIQVGFVKPSYAQCVVSSSSSQLSGETFVSKKVFAGSQYFIEDWLVGDVELISGEVVKSQLLRYNSLTDDLIWLESSSYRQVKLDKGLIAKFKLLLSNEEASLQFKKWNNSSQQLFVPNNTFMQLLYEGKITLFARRWNEETPKTETVYIGGRGQQVMVIIPKTSYYFLLNDNRLIGVNLNRKSFVSSLQGIFPKLTVKFLRQNRIRLKSEDDLIKALRWLDISDI